MEWLQSLASELARSASAPVVWLSIAEACLLAAVCLGVGRWVTRAAGILDPSAPAGESLSVGLATGLVMVTSVWAAFASGGRSSFTPIAISFAVVSALILARRSRARVANAGGPVGRFSMRWSLLAGAAFLAATALLYSATMQLQPRDGVQPLEFMDTAFYAILGDDLARTGVENVFSPAGFGAIDGMPAQTWYHWGEMWLAALVSSVLDASPLAARSFVVIPVLLLAAASLTGTLVRRVLGTSSRGAFSFGFVACLFLAPVPVAGPFFGEWAVGLIFGITQYGLAAVVAPLVIYLVVVPRSTSPTRIAEVIIAGCVAAILPSHILIALLTFVTVISVSAVRVMSTLRATRSLSRAALGTKRLAAWTGFLVVATIGWGSWTGHGVAGNGASPGVESFGAAWREAVLLTLIGAGAFLAVPAAWLAARHENPPEAEFYLGAMAAVAAGAFAWGARLADFNMFHIYFGAVVIFATPAAAVAGWSIWKRLRTRDHRLLAIAILVACLTQIELGVLRGTQRLQRFGPGNYAPVPVAILDAIRSLPPDAKLAYSCQPGEEISVWDGRLLAIGAHTGRRIMPMCFVSDALGPLIGGEPSLKVMGPTFASAPQRSIFPSASSVPLRGATLAFLREHAIDFIYVDAAHPNRLPVETTLTFEAGAFKVLRVTD